MPHDNTYNNISTLFQQLTQRYSKLIMNICRTYATDNTAVTPQDLYQDSMLNIWRGLNNYRGESTASTWIYRITINTCISTLRKNQRHQGHLPLTQAHQVPDHTTPPPDTNPDTQQLQQQISTLNPIDKAILHLWLDGHTYKEISDITGHTPANVAVRLHRLRHKLKKNIKD